MTANLTRRTPSIRISAGLLCLATALAVSGCGRSGSDEFNNPSGHHKAKNPLAAYQNLIAEIDLGGDLKVINTKNGNTVHDFGNIGTQVDQGFAFSAIDHAIFFLRLKHKKTQIVEFKTGMQKTKVLAEGTTFALSPDGDRLAFVKSGDDAVSVLSVQTGKQLGWSPGKALKSGFSMTGIAWLSNEDAFVETSADATPTADVLGSRASAKTASQDWFEISDSGTAVTGTSLKAPKLTDSMPLLSHDGAVGAAVFAVSRSSGTVVDELAVLGKKIEVTQTGVAAVTLGLALAPSGKRLIFVQRHEANGHQFTNLEVGEVGRQGISMERVLVPHAQLGEVAWATG